MKNLTNLISILLPFLVSLSLHAQNSIITVQAETGVAVFLDKKYVGMIKPESPVVVIPTVKPDFYQLSLKKEGYKTQHAKLDIKGGTHYMCKAGKLMPLSSGASSFITVTVGGKAVQPPPPPPPPKPVEEIKIFEGDIEIDDFQNISTADNEEDEGEDIFFIVEEMPKFKGSSDHTEFRKYIGENLQYPEEAAKAGISGRVYVQFTVNSKGNVVDVVVFRGKHPALDAEAVRVIKSSPKWTPGRQKGRPISVRYTFPIVFVLQ